MQDQKTVHMHWQHGSTPGTSHDGPPNTHVINAMFGLHHLLLNFHVESRFMAGLDMPFVSAQGYAT